MVTGVSSDLSANRPAALSGLLSDGLLEGQTEVASLLRPERFARPVDTTDHSAAMDEILRLCQVWGGASQPLLPIREGSIDDYYQHALNTEQIDAVGGLQQIEVELPARVEARRPWDFPALLVAAHKRRERWRAIDVCDLEPEDPWRPIYAAVLGLLPESPDTALNSFHFLIEDLQVDQIVPVARASVNGSLSDLVERLENRDLLTPRQFANVFMASGMQPDTSFLGESRPILPNPRATRRAAGPNLIVVVSPGSVEDLCLLWNLRGAHGDRRVLPIGIPVDAINADSLRALQEPGRATMFGLGGGGCHLVSCSVSAADLESLAALVPACRTSPVEEVLTFGPAAGRPRSHLAVWEGGRTRLNPLSDSDREVLGEAFGTTREPQLLLDVRVDGSPLPADPTMRGLPHWARFQAGEAQIPVHRLQQQETVRVSWPSSWTSLAAVAQTKGFDVRESQPGLAAATLIRALGGVRQVRWLAHHGLVALLYEMAERSGMSWWKRRWSDVHGQLRAEGVDPEALERAAVALGRDDLAIAPAGEGRAVPFDRFATTLGNNTAAERWVAWAERRHLLVRGANVECPSCRTSAWLPMAAVPPPVACAGCGREILHPYGPRDLRFTYRLGEAMRRVLETDSLGHVFALRWFVELFERGGLVGAHPGVEFVDPETQTVTSEVDVVLLFADGTLVPVEVKRRAAGFDEKTSASLNRAATALQAPWDAIAVTEPARDCEAIRQFERRLPSQPRLLITTDQMFADHVMWSMGGDPFTWAPLQGDDDKSRDEKLASFLREHDPDEIWDQVSETLLNRDLVAIRKKARKKDDAAEPDGGASDPQS